MKNPKEKTTKEKDVQTTLADLENQKKQKEKKQKKKTMFKLLG